MAQFFLAFLVKRLNPNKRTIFTFSKSVSITSSFFAESLVLVTKVLEVEGTNAEVETARTALIKIVNKVLFMISFLSRDFLNGYLIKENLRHAKKTFVGFVEMAYASMAYEMMRCHKYR
jgi:hypothetical protein